MPSTPALLGSAAGWLLAFAAFDLCHIGVAIAQAPPEKRQPIVLAVSVLLHLGLVALAVWIALGVRRGAREL